MYSDYQQITLSFTCPDHFPPLKVCRRQHTSDLGVVPSVDAEEKNMQFCLVGQRIFIGGFFQFKFPHTPCSLGCSNGGDLREKKETHEQNHDKTFR